MRKSIHICFEGWALNGHGSVGWECCRIKAGHTGTSRYGLSLNLATLPSIAVVCVHSSQEHGTEDCQGLRSSQEGCARLRHSVSPRGNLNVSPHSQHAQCFAHGHDWI